MRHLTLKMSYRAGLAVSTASTPVPPPAYLQMHITTDFRLAGGALEKRPFAERVCVIEIVPIGDPIAEIADVVAIQ